MTATNRLRLAGRHATLTLGDSRITGTINYISADRRSVDIYPDGDSRIFTFDLNPWTLTVDPEPTFSGAADLGLATTDQLIEELRARIDMDYSKGATVSTQYTSGPVPDEVILYAFRYGIGRATYAHSDAIDLVIEHAPILTKWADTIIPDIHNSERAAWLPLCTDPQCLAKHQRAINALNTAQPHEQEDHQ